MVMASQDDFITGNYEVNFKFFIIIIIILPFLEMDILKSNANYSIYSNKRWPCI
jgi:hypothetical protein